MNSASNVVFETARLYARELVPSDAENVFEYASDIFNSGFMPWSPMSMDDTKAFVKRGIADMIESPRKSFVLALCLKENDGFVGTVKLALEDDRRQASVGYILTKRFWHNGYASEAVRGLLRFAFLGLELHRAYACCDDKNIQSVRVLEAVGMRREAHFIKSCYIRVSGRYGWRSIFHYAMLQKEYLMGLTDGDYSPNGDEGQR